MVDDVWAHVGVKVEVEMMEMARRQKMNNDRSTPPNGMLLGNPQSTLLDIDGALWRIFHPNGFNGKYWAESQPGHRFHDLMEQGRYTLDQKKRKELYTEATRIIHDEKPWIELFQEVVIYGVSPSGADGCAPKRVRPRSVPGRAPRCPPGQESPGTLAAVSRKYRTYR